MSIVDHISFPCAIDLSFSMPHVTDEQRLDRRLRQAGLDLRTCPLCGHRATQEAVTVHRPGHASVDRVLLRCRRLSTVGGTQQRCPVQVLAEVPVGEPLPAPSLPAPQDLAPPPPAPMLTCEICGAEAVRESRRQRYCQPCAKLRRAEQQRRNRARQLIPCQFCGGPCYGERCYACYNAARTLPSCAPLPLPEPDPVRPCADCGRSIADRPACAVRCVECSRERHRQQTRESNLRIRGKTSEQAPEPAQDASEEVPATETASIAAEDHSAPPGGPEREEETSMPSQTRTRTCMDCKADISSRGRNAERCVPCATVRRRQQNRESIEFLRRAREKQKQMADLAEQIEQHETMRQAPRALSLSVVDLASRVGALDQHVRDLVRDVISLSPERLALLRSVLADAEEVA